MTDEEFEFDLHGHELVRYLGDSADVIVPEQVIGVEEGAFDGHGTITSIRFLSDCLVYIKDHVFDDLPFLLRIDIDHGPEQLFFESINGVLFRFDEHQRYELMRFPRGRRGEYAVPPLTFTIRKGAFGECDYLISVDIPKETYYIEAFAFAECRCLAWVRIQNPDIQIDPTAFDGCTCSLLFDGKAPKGLKLKNFKGKIVENCRE